MVLFDESLRSDFQSGDVGVLIENMQIVEWRNTVNCKGRMDIGERERETFVVLPPLIFESVMFCS